MHMSLCDCNDFVHGCRNVHRAVIRYLRRGTCPTARLISGIVKPEEAAQAMADWDAAPGKVFRILVNF